MTTRSNVKSFGVAQYVKAGSNFVDKLIDVFKEDQSNSYQVLMFNLLEQFKEVAAPIWHGNLVLNVGMDDEKFVTAHFNAFDRLLGEDSEKLEIFKVQYKLTEAPLLIKLYEWEHIEAFKEGFTARHPDRAHGFTVLFYASIKIIYDMGFIPYMLDEQDGVIRMGFATTDREEYFIITWNDNNLEKDLARINGEKQ